MENRKPQTNAAQEALGRRRERLPNAKDPVARAKVQVTDWQEWAKEFYQETTYFHLSPFELIQAVEDANRKGGADWVALDAAWQRVFGEALLSAVGPRDEGAASPAAGDDDAKQSHADESDLSDETVLGWKGAAKFVGVSVSTLQRAVVGGRFPTPMRISERRIGWSVGELREWKSKLTDRRDRR